MPPRPAPRDLRASDADRDRVITMLAAALVDGRLTADEHAERTAVALSARTLGELVPLTADLAPSSQQPLHLEGGRVITGLFGTEIKTGRWVVPPTLSCSAVCGEVVVDFREAILQDRHVVLYAHAFCGRVRLIVPSGVEVVMNGTAFFGRRRGATALAVPQSVDVPVIEVRAVVIAGEVLVRTPPRPRRWLPWRRALP